MNQVNLPLKLNPEFKAKWLAKLRDGSMKQCTGALHDREGYCCLGVAVEVYSGPDCWRDRGDDCDFAAPSGADCIPDYGDMADEDIEVLNQKIPGYTPITDGEEDTVAGFLSRMNDGSFDKVSWTFAQIADWIEVNL